MQKTNTLPTDYQNFIALSRYARWIPEENRREENLRGALDKKEKDSKKNNVDKPELSPVEKLLQDNQISRAVDLIRGINLFSNKKKIISTSLITLGNTVE